MKIPKTSRRLALCGAALVGATALRAETVLWYHFDEAPVGTRTTADSRIRNAVNPDALPGIPQSYNNGILAESSADYYPAYSNAFPTGRRWVDSRTGETGALNRCLHIVNPGKDGASWGAGHQGVVQIADDAALHLSTFTIEMFVKDLYEPNATEIDTYQPQHYVIAKKNSWSLSITGGKGNGTSSLEWSVSYANAEGTATSFGTSANANVLPRILRDGRWHHLALVVDGSDATSVKVDCYIDYVLLGSSTSHPWNGNGTKTMPGPVFYDASPIFIGRKDGETNYAWGGLIDELRISDEALTPEAFLRFANDNADVETVSYLSFDDWFGNPFQTAQATAYRCCSFVNETPRPNAVAVSVSTKVDPVREANEGLGVVRGALYSSVEVPDKGSLMPQADSSNRTLAFAQTFDASSDFMRGDFTIEGFLKLTALPNDSKYVFMGNGGKAFYLQVSGTGELSYGADWKRSVSTTAQPFADLGWHHWAVVSRRSALTTELYCDGQLVGALTGADVTVDSTGLETTKLVWFAYSTDLNVGQGLMNCAIGDVRVTARALDAQEFLSATAYVASPLASLRFEKDYTVGPYGAPTPAGSPQTGTAAFSARVALSPVVNRWGEVIHETNAASLRLNGDVVDFGRNLAVEKASEMTVEFLMRTQVVPASGAEVMRLASGDATLWSLTLGGDRRSFTVTVGDRSGSFALASALAGWGEIAFAFAKDGDGTRVTCYQNGVAVGTQTLAASLGAAVATSRLTVGSEGLRADIDEVRVLPGAADPLDLIDCPLPRGGVLLIR